MTEKYLFGAEVNQIQQTLFAASLQRQVVGGSRLLATFSEEGAALAQSDYGVEKKEDVIVKAGGNFRIIFPDGDKAQEFGEHIANTYHLLLDGKMTVAQPQVYDSTQELCPPNNKKCDLSATDKCFTCAEKALGAELDKQKRTQAQLLSSQPHAPTIAYCQPSGIGLAEQYTEMVKDDQDSIQYVSGQANRMKEVGFITKPGSKQVEPKDDTFLGRIAVEIKDETYTNWPWAKTPEDIAAWDPTRRNVAYLVADGNNMGKYFSYCQGSEQWRQLSEAMQTAVYAAIAAPIPKLIQRLNPQEIPLLPLIAAGDDVFVLLPAPYALDFAQRFCLTFAEKMNGEKIVTEIRAATDNALPPMTMSAAIVICKQSYPYNLAHTFGEDLLGSTKRVVKTIGRERGEWLSAVSFDTIIGSAGSSGRRYQTLHQPLLTTYWATPPTGEGKETIEIVEDVLRTAVTLNTLLDQRLHLKNLPNKRRAELRALFDTPPNIPKTASESAPKNIKIEQRWNRQFSKLLTRIQKTTDPQTAERVHDALKKLGEANPANGNPACWRQITRSGETYFAHGLPDLLAIWPYAQKLTEEMGQY